MSRIALIVYHKNIKTIYPKSWIDAFKKSIDKQTYAYFDIFEIDYGGAGYRIFENSIYKSEEKPNFVFAMMDLIADAKAKKYQYIFNTNCDDVYAVNRIERQIKWLQKGWDVVSSNFCLIDEMGREWHSHRFHDKIIKQELARNHNIIGHPVLAFNSTFFDDFNYDPSEIPKEDLLLWKRSIDSKKFFILPDYLLFHRVHRQMVSQPNSENR